MKVRYMRLAAIAGIIAAVLVSGLAPQARAAVTREQVEKAIRAGGRFLKEKQKDDGSWHDLDEERSKTGTTSLIVLALLTAGEPVNSPTISKALDFLRKFTPERLNSTYAVALQTMVFAAATPESDQIKIAANVNWLERAQIKPGERTNWPGSWSYTEFKTSPGDNSNSQYALLGLNAAVEVGVPVRPEVWTLARTYWERAQKNDGGFSYTPEDRSPATASMTCAGISSLIITGLKRFQGQEFLVGDQIQNCGKGGFNISLQRGTDWLAGHFFVGQNFGNSQQWKFYYLYGLERAGRLTGQRFFGDHDWYREGAEELIHDQDQLFGFWKGFSLEQDPLVATSFALLFLAKGRAPVLINKLRHAPTGDWNNDADDVRNLTNLVSRDWKNLLTWQVVDPNIASVQDLLQAPIVFLNGHQGPLFNEDGKKNLRDYVEQGGFIFAEACCSSVGFDKGFHALMEEIFPEPEYRMHPLAEDHAVWRSRHMLKPDIHPLWGIEHGCRTVVIYSPEDLSCYWNQSESNPGNPAVIKALRVGQNVVDYATGRELPADKLTVREVRDFKAEPAKRGALQIAKLRHAGDWNVAPLAVPNLMTSLRDKLGFDVVVSHKELFPRDPNLVNYPLIYIHGRAALSFGPEDIAVLRRHLEPGGGTLFADAACGSPAFDAAFRRFVAAMLPDNPLTAIPRDEDIYTKKIGYDLSDVQYSKAAGGGRDFPQLEGVKLNGHWAVIYSKYDVGCALERHSGLDCKGYNPESALRIATNVVIYSTLP
jgi:type II secretory pathway pseudopilin PulG